jgi:hypothetical protein
MACVRVKTLSACHGIPLSHQQLHCVLARLTREFVYVNVFRPEARFVVGTLIAATHNAAKKGGDADAAWTAVTLRS